MIQYKLYSEWEASHGTVSDLWFSHLRGEPTSLNPLGLVDALVGAMNYSAELKSPEEAINVKNFTGNLMKALHNTFRYGQGTKDMAGPTGLSTEQFIDKVDLIAVFHDDDHFFIVLLGFMEIG
jgi:isocitrate dehydrogenase